MHVLGGVFTRITLTGSPATLAVAWYNQYYSQNTLTVHSATAAAPLWTYAYGLHVERNISRPFSLIITAGTLPDTGTLCQNLPVAQVFILLLILTYLKALIFLQPSSAFLALGPYRQWEVLRGRQLGRVA